MDKDHYQIFSEVKNYVIGYKQARSLRIGRFDVNDNDQICDQLIHLRNLCIGCRRCDLGCSLHKHKRGDQTFEFDPHVFSNMKPSKFFIVGQNPGLDECLECEPFVGASGHRFNDIICQNGLSRNDFYITNICRCHTENNAAPPASSIYMCKAFLKYELSVMNPMFVITLGRPSFETMVPGENYGASLGNFIDSKEYSIFLPLSNVNNLLTVSMRSSLPVPSQI